MRTTYSPPVADLGEEPRSEYIMIYKRQGGFHWIHNHPQHHLVLVNNVMNGIECYDSTVGLIYSIFTS